MVRTLAAQFEHNEEKSTEPTVAPTAEGIEVQSPQAHQAKQRGHSPAPIYKGEIGEGSTTPSRTPFVRSASWTANGWIVWLGQGQAKAMVELMAATANTSRGGKKEARQEQEARENRARQKWRRFVPYLRILAGFVLYIQGGYPYSEVATLKKEVRQFLEARSITIDEHLTDLLQTGDPMEDVRQEQRALNLKKKLLAKMDKLRTKRQEKQEAWSKFLDLLEEHRKKEKVKHQEDLRALNEAMAETQKEINQIVLKESTTGADAGMTAEERERELLRMQLAKSNAIIQDLQSRVDSYVAAIPKGSPAFNENSPQMIKEPSNASAQRGIRAVGRGKSCEGKTSPARQCSAWGRCSSRSLEKYKQKPKARGVKLARKAGQVSNRKCDMTTQFMSVNFTTSCCDGDNRGYDSCPCHHRYESHIPQEFGAVLKATPCRCCEQKSIAFRNRTGLVGDTEDCRLFASDQYEAGPRCLSDPDLFFANGPSERGASGDLDGTTKLDNTSGGMEVNFEEHTCCSTSHIPFFAGMSFVFLYALCDIFRRTCRKAKAYLLACPLRGSSKKGKFTYWAFMSFVMGMAVQLVACQIMVSGGVHIQPDHLSIVLQIQAVLWSLGLLFGLKSIWRRELIGPCRRLSDSRKSAIRPKRNSIKMKAVLLFIHIVSSHATHVFHTCEQGTMTDMSRDTDGRYHAVYGSGISDRPDFCDDSATVYNRSYAIERGVLNNVEYSEVQTVSSEHEPDEERMALPEAVSPPRDSLLLSKPCEGGCRPRSPPGDTEGHGQSSLCSANRSNIDSDCQERHLDDRSAVLGNFKADDATTIEQRSRTTPLPLKGTIGREGHEWRTSKLKTYPRDFCTMISRLFHCWLTDRWEVGESNDVPPWIHKLVLSEVGNGQRGADYFAGSKSLQPN